MLSKAVIKARPSVLWCYKKELGFSRCVLFVMYTFTFLSLRQSQEEANATAPEETQEQDFRRERG